MGSFWSFPQIPKGPQSTEALLIVPLFFAAVAVYVLIKFLVGW